MGSASAVPPSRRTSRTLQQTRGPPHKRTPSSSLRAPASWRARDRRPTSRGLDFTPATIGERSRRRARLRRWRRSVRAPASASRVRSTRTENDTSSRAHSLRPDASDHPAAISFPPRSRVVQFFLDKQPGSISAGPWASPVSGDATTPGAGLALLVQCINGCGLRFLRRRWVFTPTARRVASPRSVARRVAANSRGGADFVWARSRVDSHRRVDDRRGATAGAGRRPA